MDFKIWCYGQGKSFESEVLKEMTDILRIKKTLTTPYHPQRDWMVERLNRTLKDMLAKTVNDQHNNWDISFPQVLLAYRTSSTHMSTGFTPHYMMIRREARLPLDVIASDPSKRKICMGEQATVPKAYDVAQESW